MTMSLFANSVSLAISEPSHQLECQWQHCRLIFPNHHALALHLSEDHVGWKRPEYACQWSNCNRKGVKCHSRFALVMHLRIHTGEKPFECTVADCGQSFGRMDALMRHKKTEHEQQDCIPNGMKLLNPKTERSIREPHVRSRQRKTTAPTSHRLSASHSWSWSSDEDEVPLPTLTRHHHTRRTQHNMPFKSKYKLAKAKLRYILREHELLNDEWISVQRHVKRLRTERKVLLQMLMQVEGPMKKMGMDLGDEDNDDEVESDNDFMVQQLLSEQSDDMGLWPQNE